MRWVLTFVLAACSSEEECDALSSSAGDHVTAAITADLSCDVAADCVSVGVSGSCFDRCSTVVGPAGAAALEAAVAEAEDQWCADYTCTFIVPPCAPPGEPACDGGQCVER